MRNFNISFHWLITSSTHNNYFSRRRFLLTIPLFLLLVSTSYGQDSVRTLSQPIIHQNRFSDSVAERIKDSLKLELQHAKLNDPVTERKYLTTLLNEEQQATISSKHKKRGQRFYYKLAVAFTKLRLYPLAMKCYFKTLTIEAKNDTAKAAPLVMASMDGRQLMVDINRQRDTSIVDDSIAMKIMSIHSSDISLVSKDSLSYNGDAEIKSPRIKSEEISNPFDDGKKAAAYAMMIHVRQPVSGKRKVYVLNNVGHTFITLIKYNTDSTIVSRSFGFYPKKSFPLAATPLFPSSPSTFKDDARHSWDEVSGTFISKRKFNKMLAVIKKYDHKKYQLSHTNCTDFGLEMAEQAGINITDTQGTWPLGKGNNPACTGQSMLEGKITASNDTYSGKLLLVDDLVNTKTTTHYHK
ncbi:hypothetical protein KXD93_15015 [Mucilaginibacter sp. BJC16-A38]|uniref:hypothetical protein n=1 Tax=Mucilaginibacter phenanthrenivorans TaxID=1234842 RepID=UPI0021577B77|nr:hypothetical protein [Mucilaginibacter phenanthrenivorans]MCR8558966.1 hypothetical protein [Mucilaginibacter phenanthrenivorans]